MLKWASCPWLIDFLYLLRISSMVQFCHSLGKESQRKKLIGHYYSWLHSSVLLYSVCTHFLYAEFSKMKIGQRKCEIKFVIYMRVRVRACACACACACVCVRQCCGAGDSRAFGSAPAFWGKNNCSIIDLRNKFKHMTQTHLKISCFNHWQRVFYL